MNNYVIFKEVICGGCGGSGIVTRHRKSEYDGHVYPMDENCPRCDGSAVTRVEVPLEEALIELGVLPKVTS